MSDAGVPGLVSVVMPFRNTRESFLLEAIGSVLNQTYAQWELILVDDGSEPPGSAYARRIAEDHPRKIRYVQHEPHRNLGISASRNKALSIAQGEFIAFLDADDVWSENQLEEQVHLLVQHPEAALLYGNTTYWHSWENGNSNDDIEYKLGLRAPQVVSPPKLLGMILRRSAISPCMTSVMVRRTVFDDGVFFEEEFREHYEDQVFLAKVFARYPIYVTHQCWGKYRQHSESVTADGDDSDLAMSWRLRYLQWLSVYLKDKNLGATSVGYALKTELWMLQNRQAEKVVSTLRLWRRKVRKAFGSASVA